MKGLILSIISLAVINLALGSTLYPGTGFNAYDLRQTGTMINQFIIAFAPELASLSLAAIAALGINLALKSRTQLNPEALNGMTVVITLAIFMMVYVTGSYILFAPAVIYLTLVGLGFLIFNVRKAIEDADLKGWADFVTGVGCFLLAALALGIGGSYGIITAGILAIMGLIFLVRGIGKLKEDMDKNKSSVTGGKGTSASDKSSEDKDDKEAKEDPIKDNTEYANVLSETGEEVNKLMDNLTKANNELGKILEALK